MPCATIRPITASTRAGLRKNKIHEDGQVDAAWKRNGVYFLSRGDRYLKYSNGLDLADTEGERITTVNGAADVVPTSPSIDAAFTDRTNTTWFFHGSTYVTLDSNNKLSAETGTKLRWGQERNDFTMPPQG